MRNFIGRSILAAGILAGTGLMLSPVWASNDIKMLPPAVFGSTGTNATACTPTSSGVLYWNGSDPIYCIPGFSGDGSGNVSIGGNLSVVGTITSSGLSTTTLNATTGTISSLTVNGADTALTVNNNAFVGTLQISGETMGVLSGSDSDVLVELAQAPICGINQALVKNADAFGCVNIIDLSNIGTFPVPACGSGYALTWTGSGTGFACVLMPVPPPPLTTGCNAGFMNGINSGVASCGIAAAANVSCGSGQYQTGVDGNGNPICSTPASSPTPPTCNAAGQALQFDGTNFQCVTFGSGGNGGIGAPCAPYTLDEAGTTDPLYSLPSAPDGYITTTSESLGQDSSGTPMFETLQFQCQNGTWVPTYSTEN